MTAPRVMGLDIRLDVRGILGEFAELERQTPFTIAIAMNRSGEDSNAALRIEIPRQITVRAPGLLKFVAPIPLPRPNRATKRDLSVILQTERAGRILNPLEEGEPHTMDRLGRPPAVPTDVLRPTPQTVIPRQLYPANLGLQVRLDAAGTTYYALGKGARAKRLSPIRARREAGVHKRGRLGSFEIPLGRGRSLVLQRRDGGLVALWYQTPIVKRPRVLHFEPTVTRVFLARWEPNLLGAWDVAQRTARR